MATATRTYPTVTDVVGSTPIVRLVRMQPKNGALLLVKLEFMNPGGSIKDRIGLPMIDAAERDGLLRPGGTIVEPTSGNTGVGLAMVAAQRGYRCIFVMPDKMSQEKISLLRAYGAEVVVCPTNVEPEDPHSYYSVSRRLAEEIPGAWKPDQYSNANNPAAHYAMTGPELWEQMGEDLDILVAGVGTGGTITGTSRYLRERLAERGRTLEVVGADPEGSIYSSKDVHGYLVEGVGEDFWPTTFDPAAVDRWITVSDRDAFQTARRAAREEGLLIGGSAGLALHAALQVAREAGPDRTVLCILPDGGRPYLSKIFNDQWMGTHGMLEPRAASVSAVVGAKVADGGEHPPLVAVHATAPVADAIELLQRYAFSQLPVVDGEDTQRVAALVGSVTERDLLEQVFRDPATTSRPVGEVMAPPLAVVQSGATMDVVYRDLQERSAVVVADGDRPVGVLTRSDLLEFLAQGR